MTTIIYGGQGNVQLKHLHQMMKTEKGQALLLQLQECDCESHQLIQDILNKKSDLQGLYAAMLTTFLYNAWARQEVVDQIKEVLIDSLMLDLDKDLIINDQPLFGRGLELDSIDALELSIGLSTTFGVEINDDDMAVLSSVNKLADFVIENSEDSNDED